MPTVVTLVMYSHSDQIYIEMASKPFPATIAACLCFRDSAPYLHEWLLFHCVQGISRFYLYDNDSFDDHKSVLAPWIEAGVVQCRRWPGLGQQQAIYDDCLAKVDSDVDWLAFIDDDEFVFAVDGSPLQRTLCHYENFAGVAVSWLLFGTNGHKAASSDWIIERFTRSASGADPHVKCIIRPARIVRSTCVGHAFEPKPGFAVVDERQRVIEGPFAAEPSCEVLRINHYITRSESELIARRLMRPEANTGRLKPHKLEDWLLWDTWWTTTPNAIATQFIPAMLRLDRELFGAGNAKRQELSAQTEYRRHPASIRT